MNDHRRRIWRTRVVAFSTMALSIGLPLSTHAASSGSESEIRFYGRIVAPPYSIDTSSLAHASSSFNGTAKAGASADAIAVTFSTAGADKPAATVSFYGNGAGSLSIGPDAHSDIVTRFVDTKGHQVAWQASHDYYLKQNQGLLTLSVDRPSALQRLKPVTVMVNYE